MATPDKQSSLMAVTLRGQQSAQFRHDRPPLRWVGLLTPLAGLARNVIRIDSDELTLGRKNCDAVLSDESVSRLHARIRRDGDDFILEDLGSFNGCHLDGVPVLSCVLHDGDTVQFGQNLFLFERLLERADPPARDLP
jgi:pSer/pThr/pTyr-binding forkhead associated (FHA) protein